MKIKTDFVTNSSSTSYIVSVYKVKNMDKIQDFLKEEFGKLGSVIYEKCLMSKEKIYNNMDLDDRSEMPYDDDVSIDDFKKLLSDSENFLYSSSDLHANAINSLKSNDIVEHVYSHDYQGYDG